MKRRRTHYFSLLVLTGSLLGLLLSMNLSSIVVSRVIAPRAVHEKQGWWVCFSGPSRVLPVDGYQVFLPAGKTVALNPDFKHATAWILWSVPVDGQYKIQFTAEAVSEVSLDGRTIFNALPKSESRRVEECWRRIRQGRHLVRMELSNEHGGGWFSIGVLTPPLMRLNPLQGDMVAMPKLGNLETWWWVMRLSRPLAFSFACIGCGCLLVLLLPLTVADRRYSVGVTILLVVVPVLLIPDLSRREPYIGPMVHRELRQRQPQFVFIGNSMLWSRIDDELLAELLGGVPVFSIVNFGGLSGIHYLALKYLLIPSGIHPKRVFIFFRGTTLVQPTARTSGPYFDTLIKRITPAPDAEFEQLAHGRTVSVVSGIRSELQRIFAVQGNRQAARDAVGRLALFLSVPGSGKEQQEERTQLRDLVNNRFTLKNVGAGMDRESLHSSSGKATDFNSAVADSFLPAIIRLAREHDLPLAFIRVQERPPEKGVMRDTPEMQQFMAELRAYLKTNGVALYDFTGDTDLPLAMYGQGDHIEDPRQYTPIFYRRLRAFLQ